MLLKKRVRSGSVIWRNGSRTLPLDLNPKETTDLHTCRGWQNVLNFSQVQPFFIAYLICVSDVGMLMQELLGVVCSQDVLVYLLVGMKNDFVQYGVIYEQAPKISC